MHYFELRITIYNIYEGFALIIETFYNKLLSKGRLNFATLRRLLKIIGFSYRTINKIVAIIQTERTVWKKFKNVESKENVSIT